MTVFFNRIQRKNPMVPEGPKKWFSSLRKPGMMKEAGMALHRLRKVMLMALETGRSVQLSQPGAFCLTASAAGAREDAMSPLLRGRGTCEYQQLIVSAFPYNHSH